MVRLIFLLMLYCSSILNCSFGKEYTIPQYQDSVRLTSQSMRIILSTTYVTQHYWRGIGRGGLFGKAPSFELQIAFNNKKWSIGVFAGASFDNIYKALMPFVIYRVTPDFTIAVQDIYSPSSDFWKSNFFVFNIYTSSHFVDYYMQYKIKNTPLQIKWATVVLGKDPNSKGKRNFSSYAEVSGGYKLSKWQFDGYIGATPWKGLYAKNEAGINNLEVRVQCNFVVNKDVPMPVFVKGAYNPISKLSHIVGGCTVNLSLK